MLKHNCSTAKYYNFQTIFEVGIFFFDCTNFFQPAKYISKSIYIFIRLGRDMSTLNITFNISPGIHKWKITHK